MRVAVAVGSESSFRLSVDFFDGADDVAPLASPSLDPMRKMAPSSRPAGGGVKTAFGELLVDNEGKFTLKDAAGKVVVRASGPPRLVMQPKVGTAGVPHEGISMPVTGSKTGPGANGRRPCLVNGGWGPPFTWDPVDNFFAFAVSPWGYDPDYIHCCKIVKLSRGVCCPSR